MVTGEEDIVGAFATLVESFERMIKVDLKQVVILVFSGILCAFAANAEGPDESETDENSRRTDCISGGTIRDYTVLDDANLIVSGVGKRRYHVTLQRRAFAMRSAWQIGFTSPTGRICAGFSEIIFYEGMGTIDRRPERIRVKSIRQLTPEEMDELLIRFGKKKPEFEQTPAHEPVDGAEVEELD